MYRETRALVVTMALLLGAAACDTPGRETATAHAKKTAEAPPPRPSAATKPQPKKAELQRCVVPTPEVSPPEAPPAAQCPADPDGPLDMPRVIVEFPDAPTKPQITAEHATHNNERSRGLMYRTALPDDEGMLFSWNDERPRSFWMKNTCLPLDMLFLAADGTIAGILEQVPTLNLKSRRVPCPAQHVLEVSAGWCRRHGVKAGQRVNMHQ